MSCAKVETYPFPFDAHQTFILYADHSEETTRRVHNCISCRVLNCCEPPKWYHRGITFLPGRSQKVFRNCDRERWRWRANSLSHSQINKLIAIIYWIYLLCDFNHNSDVLTQHEDALGLSSPVRDSHKMYLLTIPLQSLKLQFLKGLCSSNCNGWLRVVAWCCRVSVHPSNRPPLWVILMGFAFIIGEILSGKSNGISVDFLIAVLHSLKNYSEASHFNWQLFDYYALRDGC